jgi:hypothetical protein
MLISDQQSAIGPVCFIEDGNHQHQKRLYLKCKMNTVDSSTKKSTNPAKDHQKSINKHLRHGPAKMV